MPNSHVIIDPAILYFGTPVALLSTMDATGQPNVAPMSSIFWLGQTAVLGMSGRSQTARNLRSTGEVVINLPSVGQVEAVNRLALTTGRDPVPANKGSVGYRHVRDKFSHAGVTPLPSEDVRPFRIRECPVNLEGRVVASHTLEGGEPDDPGNTFTFEIAVTRVHVHPSIRSADGQNRVDPDRWRPLIMSFQGFYGLGTDVLHSTLAAVDEEWYR
jgi:flavin reductase (DIM6/NTAB) family NADH-FMN oxidoreductase RutF